MRPISPICWGYAMHIPAMTGVTDRPEARLPRGSPNPSLLRSATFPPSGGKGKERCWASVDGKSLAPSLYPVDRGSGGSAKPRRSGTSAA